MTKQMVFKRFLKTDIDSVITEALWTDMCVCVCVCVFVSSPPKAEAKCQISVHSSKLF